MEERASGQALGNRPEAELPRIVAGRYRVVRLLGSGGMGSVYLVRDALADDAPRALKEMLIAPGASAAELAQTQERFAREARLLASMSHPSIPQVYDFFSEAGRGYLVMDYVEGETLEQRVEREGAQSEAQTLTWAEELCAALEYLHAQTPPVIFRDVAADNVMVDATGHLHLIDFGIARVFNPAKQTDTLRFGKVGYAPPEQFGGGGQTTPRSDIFALGALLFFLLSGRDPAQKPFVFPSLDTLNPSVSPSLAAAVAHAVQLDPAQRPADTRSFAAELGVTLPPLVLSPRASALPGELEPAPSQDASPRALLVAFHISPRSTQQIMRQAKMVTWVFGGFIGVMVIIMALFSFLFPLPSYGDSFRLFDPSFTVVFALMFGTMIPFIWLARYAQARRLSRVRVIIGRDGVLFSPLIVGIAPIGKRTLIPWSALERIESGAYLTWSYPIGTMVYLYLRKRSGAHLGWWAWLSARMNFIKANLGVAESALEQIARPQSPVPAMTFSEALQWYWDVPARREELARLPGSDHELEGALRPDDAPPPERWIGAPAWIAFALFVAITQLQTVWDVWRRPEVYAYTPYGVTTLALTTIGLFLLLLRARQHDWLFKLGGLALTAGALMYFIALASLSAGSYGDVIFAGQIPFLQLGITWIIIFEVGAFWMMFMVIACLRMLAERRDDARENYTLGEVGAVVGALVAYAILPGLQDVANSLSGGGPIETFRPLLSFAVLPHLVLITIALAYFHGTTPRIRRWTTLGIFVMGLGMIFGAAGLYAGALWQLWLAVAFFPASAPLATYLAIGGYFALNAIAGVLIAVFAWRKLRSLSPTGHAFYWRQPSAPKEATALTQ